MHLAIDASNIRYGGGVTHLSQLLSAANPLGAGFSKVTVWSSAATASQLPNYPWLRILSPRWVEAGIVKRMFGQKFLLGQEMKQLGCDCLFSPGGTLPLRTKVPLITMSQNMLPFEPEEAKRFGRWSLMRFKMWLLRQFQMSSFNRADGLIFLTEYARAGVTNWLRQAKDLYAVIPHGVESRFSARSEIQSNSKNYSNQAPFTFLYVSLLMPYKHQIEVAKAANVLRRSGYPIRVRFVGANWGSYGQQFCELLKNLDPKKEFLEWPGSLPFSSLHAEYNVSDAFIFASSCENLPNILLEAMAAGLPIACSNRGPMQEILNDAGVYFDPLNVSEIAEAMRTLFDNFDLRLDLGAQASMLSRTYSWQKCAEQTFQFIAEVAMKRPIYQAV